MYITQTMSIPPGVYEELKPHRQRIIKLKEKLGNGFFTLKAPFDWLEHKEQIIETGIQRKRCMDQIHVAYINFFLRSVQKAMVRLKFVLYIKPHIECSPGGAMYNELANKYKEIML